MEAASASISQGNGGATGDTEGNGSQEPIIRVDEPPKFDLEAYIGNYTGRTKWARLYLIGTCSTYLSTEALKMAVTEAKNSKDIRAYIRSVQALAKVAPDEKEAVFDQAWVDEKTRTVKAETERLEHELKGYKNNLIKESIRMGNEDLGQHYHRIGDLNAAAKAFSRMRDFCTTSSQIASMHFKNIVVAIDARNWLAVQSNVHRLQTTQFRKDEEARCKAKMSAALGLSMLATAAYKDAAVAFMDTDPSLGDSFREVITPNDVAVYGGLCALASMDRGDLLTRVLEDKNFRSYLELEPHIRRAISFFCASKFRPCFDILEAYLPDYLLDIYLQSHVRVLYEKIRVKAMQQYIIPYSRVTLAGVAKVFYPGQSVTNEAGATDISSPVVSELISYIQDGVLNARIDLEKGVLAINQAAAREEVHGKAIDMAREYVNTAHLQLLRIGVLNAGLDVPPPRSRRGGDTDSMPSEELFLPSQMGGAGRKGPGSWLSSEAAW